MSILRPSFDKSRFGRIAQLPQVSDREPKRSHFVLCADAAANNPRRTSATDLRALMPAFGLRGPAWVSQASEIARFISVALPGSSAVPRMAGVGASSSLRDAPAKVP